MPEFRVYAEQMIGVSRVVEAENEDQAREKFHEDGVPGLMFLDHTYPDEGEWNITSIEEQG